MQKELVEEIVKLTTAEVLKQRDNLIEEELDNRYLDVRLLMKNYRKLKIHYSQVDVNLNEVDSICSMRRKTGLMMSHVDKMLDTYKTLCQESSRIEEKRRWNALYLRYVADERTTIEEISEILEIDRRTFYRDINHAFEDMAVLLFGIEAMGKWKYRKKKKHSS